MWQERLSIDLLQIVAWRQFLKSSLNLFKKIFWIAVQSVFTQNKTSIAFSKDCTMFCAFFSPCSVWPTPGIHRLIPRSFQSTLPIQPCASEGTVNTYARWQSAWRTTDRDSGHCTGDRDQDHPPGKQMQKRKMAVWGGLTNSCGKKRSEKQRKKGKI